jgi:hypothetical protein
MLLSRGEEEFMQQLIERAGRFLDEFAARFRVTRDAQPIDTLAGLNRFAATRAAFVGQKKLYEYLKTRMGTRYPTVFENDEYVASINVAKLHVVAACLSDLTVHAVAVATAGSGLAHDVRSNAARRCFLDGIAGLAEAGGDSAMSVRWSEAFEKRLADIHWENSAAGHDAFSASPKALVRWAPIADELKRYDASIVRNSIRYAWNEVIRDYRRRAVPEVLAAEIASLDRAD